MWQYRSTDELYHYGILGMRWGIRRQNSIDKYEKKYNKLKTNNLKNLSEIKAQSKKRISKIKNKNIKMEAKAKARLTEAKNSRYGKTNGKIITNGILRSIGGSTLAGAANIGILASGAAFTPVGLAALTGINIANQANLYSNIGSTIVGVTKNHRPKDKK